MQVHKLLLTSAAAERADPVHYGKLIVMRSNLRWCSDDFEFTCWNGNIIRGAFVIDAHDREILAWCVVVNTGISGSDIRDILLEAVERRFGTCRAPETIEFPTDNGSPYIAREARVLPARSASSPVSHRSEARRAMAWQRPSSTRSNATMSRYRRCQMPKRLCVCSRTTTLLHYAHLSMCLM